MPDTDRMSTYIDISMPLSLECSSVGVGEINNVVIDGGDNKTTGVSERCKHK